MSSKQGRSLINPLVQSKMEGANGSPGLPRADSLSHYSYDKSLPISRGYFSYSLSGQDAPDFNSLWDSSRTSRNRSSPGIRLFPTDGSVTIPGIYRPELISFPVDGSGRSVRPQELAAKQRLAYYVSSPRHHSPRAAGVISPAAVPKGHITASIMSSTHAESCAGLTIPKPVYGHSPCCTERGCSAGQNYGMEHRSHRLSPRVYEDEWAAHFSRLAYLHKKSQETLEQQRALQFECAVEGMPSKDEKTEGYYAVRSHGPDRSRPSHSSFTYNTPHPFMGSISEFCQRAPIPQQTHSGLPSTYDLRTLNHDRPHVSKYTHIPPYSYYPQSHTEAYRADLNVVTDEFCSPRPECNSISTSCPEVPPHHPLITTSAHHPYAMRFNSTQTPTHERLCALLPLHQSERPLDFSVRRVHTPDAPRELCRQSGTSGAFQPTSAHHRRPSNTSNTAAERSAFGHTEVTVIDFPVGGCKEYVPTSHKELFKKERMHSPSKRHGEESEGGSETNRSKKQKTEGSHEQSEELQSPCSPPMPVINKVFSLASYKVCFEATGVLPSQENSERSQLEVTQLKQEPGIQNGDLEANPAENDLSPKQAASPANSNRSFKMDKTVQIKQEKLDSDETAYRSEMKVCVTEERNHQVHNSAVKEEHGELGSDMSGSVPDNIVIKTDLEEESNPSLAETSEPFKPSATCKTEQAVKESVTVSHSVPPAPPPLTTFSLSKIPPHCLKLSNYKIVMPEILKAPVTQAADVPQSSVETKSTISSSKQARHQFMELHQSLCRLMHSFVTCTPCQELKECLRRLDLRESLSHPSKAQNVSCLLGWKVRAVWLKGEEMLVALQKVVCQLQKYVDSRECPFPHVMRAGAAFIPMLVVKEVLFPQIQGNFIDQVLQEHRVELRPTTLSEERQLTQLHRKAFSSKLRRLLSLKHLPDIYPDVLNLLYYTSACKFLGAKASLTFKRESTDSSDESVSRVDGPEDFYLNSLMASTTKTTCVKLERRYCLKTKKKKGRVRISSKRMFLEESSSSQKEEFTGEPERWRIVKTFETGAWEVSPVTCSEREANVEVEIEDDNLEKPDIAAWRRPLTSDDFSDGSNEETESTSSLSYQSHRSSSGEFQGLSKGPSSMVLKLRKVFFSEGHKGRGTHYQKVTDTLEAQGSLRGHKRFRSTECYRKKKHKLSSRPTDRKFSSRLHSLYPQNCNFLSTKHRSKRRWVLRSAVQSARFPDLVGKRIRHLYEEKDKTEVWYRGVVLRVHEPHPNPLQTVFEVKYDSEPEWQYYLELLLDYKKGWLKVED